MWVLIVIIGVGVLWWFTGGGLLDIIPADFHFILGMLAGLVIGYVAKSEAKSPYDYYAILGIDKTADQEAVKAAYREMAKRFHPDNVNNNEWAKARFIEIQEAYEVLRDSEKRTEYDKSLG